METCRRNTEWLERESSAQIEVGGKKLLANTPEFHTEVLELFPSVSQVTDTPVQENEIEHGNAALEESNSWSRGVAEVILFDLAIESARETSDTTTRVLGKHSVRACPRLWSLSRKWSCACPNEAPVKLGTACGEVADVLQRGRETVPPPWCSQVLAVSFEMCGCDVHSESSQCLVFFGSAP